MSIMTNNDPASLIERRRLQILVHSCIYYHLNSSLITDQTFDQWGRELVELQRNYPELAKTILYHEAFKDWDASTGAFLPYKDFWVLTKAKYLLRISKEEVVKIEHTKIQQSPRVKSSKKPEGKKTSKLGRNSLF